MLDWHNIDYAEPATLPPVESIAQDQIILWLKWDGTIISTRGKYYGDKRTMSAWMIPPSPPRQPTRRKHSGRVAFISDSGSKLAVHGTWTEVLPGDIDPDAALRLHDAAEKVIQIHDSGVLERQPHDSRSIDELRAAVGECRR